MARWHSCNILHLAPDGKRVWQFDAKGKGFVLKREHRVAHADALPANLGAKSWNSLWQPKLNIAWLPSESVFLRVIELPAANADETFSMVELQLEKLSPIPVTQIVWTMQILGTHQSPAKADGTIESLQSVIVVIAARATVEEFLGRLERDGFLSDRLEVPMLDQLEAVQPQGDSVWLFPLSLGGQNAALVAWWFGGAFGHRCYIDYFPAFAFPMAIAMEKIFEGHRLYLKIPVTMVILLMLYYSVEMSLLFYPTHGFWDGPDWRWNWHAWANLLRQIHLLK